MVQRARCSVQRANAQCTRAPCTTEMLSFLSPLFLIAALTAAVPVILHLLKREPEPRVKFPAVRLLKRAPVAYTERRRLREWLLLALRVAALVLLAVAFARPFVASAGDRGSPGV